LAPTIGAAEGDAGIKIDFQRLLRTVVRLGRRTVRGSSPLALVLEERNKWPSDDTISSFPYTFEVSTDKQLRHGPGIRLLWIGCFEMQINLTIT